MWQHRDLLRGAKVQSFVAGLMVGALACYAWFRWFWRWKNAARPGSTSEIHRRRRHRRANAV